MIHFTSFHDFCSYIMNYVPFNKNKSKVALTIKNMSIINEDGEIVGIYKPERKQL